MAIEASNWNNTFDPWKGLTAAWYWAGSGQFAYNLTIGVAPIAFAVFGLVMIGVGVWKRLRPSYILYMFLILGIGSFDFLVDKRTTLHHGDVSNVYTAWRFNKEKSSQHCPCSFLCGLALLLYGAVCVGLVGILKKLKMKRRRFRGRIDVWFLGTE